MEKFGQWLEKLHTKLVTTIGLVLGLIATFYITKKIIAILKFIHESNWSKVLMGVAEILAIILITTMGIYGFHKLFKMFEPAQDLIPTSLS